MTSPREPTRPDLDELATTIRAAVVFGRQEHEAAMGDGQKDGVS